MAINMKLDTDITRRDFFKGSAGLSFAIAVSGTGGLLLPSSAKAQMAGSNISAWLTISSARDTKTAHPRRPVRRAVRQAAIERRRDP